MKYVIIILLVIGIALLGTENVLAQSPNSPPSDNSSDLVSDQDVPPPGQDPDLTLPGKTDPWPPKD